jgi:monoamine oxidase
VLFQRYSEGLNIQLNTEVTSIVWTPQHLVAAVQQQTAAHSSKQEQRAAADTADASSQHVQYQVSQQQQQCAYAATTKTAAGRHYQADAVVVTASIAALQQGGITFDPPLSEPKLAAVRALRMEAATKLIYCFSKQLWPDELTYMCHTGELEDGACTVD